MLLSPLLPLVPRSFISRQTREAWISGGRKESITFTGDQFFFFFGSGIPESVVKREGRRRRVCEWCLTAAQLGHERPEDSVLRRGAAVCSRVREVTPAQACPPFRIGCVSQRSLPEERAVSGCEGRTREPARPVLCCLSLPFLPASTKAEPLAGGIRGECLGLSSTFSGPLHCIPLSQADKDSFGKLGKMHSSCVVSLNKVPF